MKSPPTYGNAVLTLRTASNHIDMPRWKFWRGFSSEYPTTFAGDGRTK
jgi:hypothetical protein